MTGASTIAVGWTQEFDDGSGDVIHNHFDCPVCGKANAETDIFDAPEVGATFECECGARFTIVELSDDREDAVIAALKGEA